ncbi:LysM peptidoglycan-binding domain-containing protein [Flavobacterium sp. NST-5]|uniref:LysM peptidoglycan-binding domain-containing protein n=1 Tax=Flavobacterium ichthyis TaxID=2698827 RepID=A0ABW9ZD36_9FLAO|nr:LysM peptidoglycan-binding domain-containing protein [Flavobacterium ichthyis]NBL65232.1 LysM peptidoglycan-binding domain-containing protein [Flavobacterium ichthyis]
MKKLFISVAAFLLAAAAFAQEAVKHTVSKGETITQISQKYKVTPADIYALNPDARNGIGENTILLIPNKSGNKITQNTPKTVVSNGKTHTVAPKETIYGLAKQYNVSVADLEKLNPEIKEGLKIGQVLQIPGKSSQIAPMKQVITEVVSEQDQPASKGNLVYEVVPKDTKYGIAKKHGITVEELEKFNPILKTDSLRIGQRVVIRQKDFPNSIESNSATIVKPTLSGKEAEKYTTYQVRPKETIYSLSRQFGLSQNGLIALNPELENGLKEGMMLKVPKEVLHSPLNKNFSDLAKTISKKDRKQMTLLLPFNVSKIESDSTANLSTRLKKDAFLNMTLDFYSGALMAIDSAKSLGLNIDIKILDSQENKNSSAVNATFADRNLLTSDVVIGPFYQSHAEQTAQFLNAKNIPVISPLSKDNSMVYSNLYQSVPSPETLRGTLFDYLYSKNANVIAVIDPKKVSAKNYIAQNHPTVKISDFSLESAKAMLAKDRKNFVILETSNTLMLKNIVSGLAAAKATHDVQLVLMEPNDKLDSDEISIANLAKLNLLYPSVTRENETPEAAIFAKNYKKKNNIYPNQYATRGFDVTFDAMLRLSQEKSFEETIFDNATEQVENKFNYVKNPADGYSNRGVYILYYDTDLTVKVAQ